MSSELNSNIKLSVILFCYNQIDFIRSAIESVLSQQTNFEFNIIITDDGSTDGTQEIIGEYATRFPQKISIVESTKNAGILSNALSVKSFIQSEYVAFLDGDDYWVEDQKLQRQVDFLESNSGFSGTFHDAKIDHLDEVAKIKLFTNKNAYSEVYNYSETVSPLDIINRVIIPTSSLVLRSNFLSDKSLALINDNYSLDWKLLSIAIKNSKLYYFNEKWSVYRNHVSGFSKINRDSAHWSHIKFLKSLLKDSYYRKFKFELGQVISSEYYQIFNNTKNRSLKRKIGYSYVKAELYKLWQFFKKIHNLSE